VEQEHFPKIAVGCTGAIFALALLGTTAALLAPILTSGAASWEESLPFIASGGVCCFFSAGMLVGAIVWLVQSRPDAQEPPGGAG
jgi:hypothetical protein